VSNSEVSNAYRLWKPSTKTIIKARDEEFVESIADRQDELSKETLHVSYFEL